MLAPSPRRVGKPPTAPHEGVPMGSRQESQAADGARRAGRGVADTSMLLSSEERAAQGRAARREAPRSSHAAWRALPDRLDPISLLEEQAASRVPELTPIRHGRMLASPFAFYRGAALPMAADLAATPRSGLNVQLCGDAHLANFGVFASPERQMLFDINDFDETLPGPWEWDVKRMAASFEVAGRELGFSAADRRDVVLAGAREYRRAMRRAAKMGVLEAWYSHLTVDDLMTWIAREVRAGRLGKGEAGEAARDVAKARTRVHQRAFRRLTTEIDGKIRIAADPPLVVPIDDLVEAGTAREHVEEWMRLAGARLPQVAGGGASPDGGVPLRRHGAQGGGRRQRRHPRLDPAVRGSRPRQSPVPAGQGSAGLGTRALRRQEPVWEPRPAGRRGAAPDAGGQRYLPGLVAPRGP